MLKTGDIFFVSGRGWISRLIRWVTKGDISHVGIVYARWLVFEADGIWGKARFRPLDDYQESTLVFRRLKSMTDQHRAYLKGVCREYEGLPYSYWDIFLNFVAAPLPRKARHWFVSKLGNKKFVRCGELAMRVIYRVTGYELFKDFERSNPAEIFEMIEKTGDFEGAKIK